MNVLYLVTRSYHYYPASGTGDWKHLTSEPDEAKRVYDELECDRADEDKYLIQLSADGGPGGYAVLESTE